MLVNYLGRFVWALLDIIVWDVRFVLCSVAFESSWILGRVLFDLQVEVIISAEL
jgi:hypothetical protein